MHNNININVSGPVQPTSTYKTKVLKGNHSFASQVTEPNMKYVIKHNFDLGGENVTIPEGCLLEFDGGAISNGTLVGQSTFLIYNQSLNDILTATLEGTWKHDSGVKADEVYDNTQQKNQETINSELIAAVGTGGSVDSRIVAAVNVEKTRAEGAEIALDNRVDTLEEAVGTGGSIDSRISSAVLAEATRAQAAEQLLQEQYDALTQNDIEVGALPASGTKNIIYRVPGTNSYSDYMWNGTQFVKMAEYDNAIDNKPTVGSNNLVKSGGVAAKISGIDTILNFKFDFSNDGFIHTDGSIDSSLPNAKVTDYIFVEPGMIINYSLKGVGGNTIPMIAGYSTNTSVPQGFVNLVPQETSLQEGTITIPEGVYYIRTWSLINNFTPVAYIKNNIVDSLLKTQEDVNIIQGTDWFETPAYTNAYLTPQGQVSTGYPYSSAVTDFIPCKEGDVFYYKGKFQSNPQIKMVFGYPEKSESNAIPLLTPYNGTILEEVVIPSGVNYIRAWSLTSVNPYIILKSSTAGILKFETDFFPIEPKPITIDITVVRNIINYNSIRDTIAAITDASASRRYVVHIPNGEWFESDIQGKDYVSLVGESREGTILYCDGTSSVFETPSDYSYTNYASQVLSSISRQYKHCFFALHNLDVSNLTVKVKECKYCVHLDDSGYSNIKFTNCHFITMAAVSYVIGIGIHGGQSIHFSDCIFERLDSSGDENIPSRFGFFCHNWNNQTNPANILVENSLFKECDFVLLDELGSEQEDIFKFINCHSTLEGRCSFMVDFNSNGDTYWNNGSGKESNPQNVPYCIKFISSGSNTSLIFPNMFGGTNKIVSRPNIMKYVICDHIFTMPTKPSYTTGYILRGYWLNKTFSENLQAPIFGIVEYILDDICYISKKDLTLNQSDIEHSGNLAINMLLYENSNHRLSAIQHGNAIGVITSITDTRCIIKLFV